MNPVITRMEAISACGRGVGALADGLAAGRARVRAVPWASEALRSPFAALAGLGEAEELLDAVVSAVRPAEGACGLVVATSSGAITGAFERWHRHGGEEEAWRQAPTRRVAARHGLAPHTTLSVACASGSAAFATARGWLRDGLVERVIVAGVDALSLYVHAGFAGLGALAKEACRPFQPGRDGLVLGEGAAAVLLESPAAARAAGRPAIATLRGIGLSQDAVHLTAPDRTGDGLARAVRAALADAGLDAGEIDAVSAHGTATSFNDAMEARALATVFGGPVPLHAPKAVLGHTLGAAGAIEAVGLLAMMSGAEPMRAPSLVAEDCPLTVREAREPRVGLSVNAAFGGVNAAVVFGPAEETAAPRSLVASEVARVCVEGDDLPLSKVHPAAPPALGRADTYVRAGIAALARLGEVPEGAAVVVASETNCRAADLRYHAGLVAGGPAQASRVHFTYTIPGAPLAEAAILLGLRGPALVFCDTAERAHAEARGLVSRGEAPAAIALAVEAPERRARAEAVLYAGVRP
ncbi:MAG: beta-ketoacyl synthase N-terminal-like domain-containing protein [Myxococcota bacterium]